MVRIFGGGLLAGAGGESLGMEGVVGGGVVGPNWFDHKGGTG